MSVVNPRSAVAAGILMLGAILGSVGGGFAEASLPEACAPCAPCQDAAVTDADIEKSPVEALLRKRAGTLGQLRKAARGDILVVKGSQDEVEQVLECLEIPHSTLGPEELSRTDLSACRILLINSHFSHNSLLYRTVETGPIEREIQALTDKESALRKQVPAGNGDLLRLQADIAAKRQLLENVKDAARGAENVRRFVARGGSLFTEDWAISVLERAFPGTVARGGKTGPIMTVVPKAHPKTRSALLDEVLRATPAPQPWTLGFESYLIRVEKATVDVLLETSDLPKLTALAVVFSPDKSKGKVLHLLPHFKGPTGQTTKPADYALQNLLLNFLAERLNR